MSISLGVYIEDIEYPVEKADSFKPCYSKCGS